jgi:hypothetical protein
MDKEDYKKGDMVLYVPPHAAHNVRHPDCEEGVVSSSNDKFVFVDYGTGVGKGTDREYLGKLVKQS